MLFFGPEYTDTLFPGNKKKYGCKEFADRNKKFPDNKKSKTKKVSIGYIVRNSNIHGGITFDPVDSCSHVTPFG